MKQNRLRRSIKKIEVEEPKPMKEKVTKQAISTKKKENTKGEDEMKNKMEKNKTMELGFPFLLRISVSDPIQLPLVFMSI